MLCRHLIVFLTFVSTAFAASSSGGIDGSQLGLIWVIPFALLLGAIAFLPMVVPKFWHSHFGKLSGLTAAVVAIAMWRQFSFSAMTYEIVHMLCLEYIPFIVLLLSLFTISGGIYIKGQLAGSPKLNSVILMIGTVLASWIGTTGAAMLLIRPLIRANAWRKHKAHIVIFFIFLVANIGGALTPLGDPPLFLGFLNGVDFFWTTVHLLGPMIVMAVPLLIIFYGLDSYYYKKEASKPTFNTDKKGVSLHGGLNFLWLGGVLAAVLLSGFWNPGLSFSIVGTKVTLQNISRELLLLGFTAGSLLTTPKSIRTENQFSWFPIQEVAKLFIGIFVSIIPVIHMLKAETDPVVKYLVQLLYTETGEPINAVVFWITGLHSSILDNAPSYLIFFNALEAMRAI